MAAERGGLFRRKSSGEAVENGVVCVEYLDWTSELGTVPVVVSGENGRLGLRVDTENESFHRLIGGKCLNLENGTGEKEEEEKL